MNEDQLLKEIDQLKGCGSYTTFAIVLVAKTIFYLANVIKNKNFAPINNSYSSTHKPAGFYDNNDVIN